MSTFLRTLPPLAAVLAAGVAVPATASAQTVERTVVAGPSADLAMTTDDIAVAAAPDGTSAIAFLQKVGGVDRVHVSRRSAAGWSPPELMTTGFGECDVRSTRPAIAAANGGKVVVVFPAGAIAGQERLCAMVAPSAGAPFVPPSVTGFLNPVAFIEGDPASWRSPEIDLAPNGDGYVSAHAGPGSFDVYALRLQGTTFTHVGDAVGPNYPNGKLNGMVGGQADPGDQRQARIAVSDDGATATIAWTETPGAGYKFWARRITGAGPADIGPAVDSFVPTLEGRTGSDAFSDMGWVAQGGGTTYVAFRHAFDVNGTDIGRLVARSFDGAAFGPPQIIDGLPEPPAESGEVPRIAMNAAGQGLSASYRQNSFFAEYATLAPAGMWTRGARVNPLPVAAPSRATAALSESGAGLVAFLRPDGVDNQVLGRIVGGGLDGTALALSDPSLGAARSPYRSAATTTDGLTAFVQGSAATTRIVAAVTPLLPAVAPPAPPTGPGAPGTPGPVPTDLPASVTAPRITKLAVVPSRFRRGTRNPVRTTKAPKTPRLRFTLDRDARVTLSAERARGGRSVGGRCVAPTRSNRRRKACTRYVRVTGSKVISAKRGLNHVRFEGRFSNRRVLSPGRYRIIAVARAGANATSKASRARFTLLAPRRR